MNRTDRLLAIVLELQGKGRQRGDDLAATFEVSKRTIYRDMEALCEMGVPVVSIPGRGYSLVEGYFLPPLRFTTDEAFMLILGSDVMAQSFDAEYKLAAQSAGRKIAGALPEALCHEAQSLQESIRFIVSDRLGMETGARLLQQVRRAIIKRRTVQFEYNTRAGRGDHSARNVREADPYGLANVAGSWYMVAYCHLRRGIRNFRVTRMESLHILDKEFKQPTAFHLQQPDDGSRKIIARVLFSAQIADWVRENPSFYEIAQKETPDGLMVTFSLRQESDLLQWLLSWGRHARVLEPPGLAVLLREEAEAILQNHRNPSPLLT